MNNRDNLIGVFQTVFRWRKTIRNVCLLALVGSIAFSLLLDNYFQATTIFYPSSPRIANPELLFGNTGQVVEYYGSDRDLDRMAEIATSKEVEDFMVSRFGLYAHYEMDSTSQKGRHLVREMLRSLYQVQKNKNDAIELRVEDKDPQVAADMANAAREKINEIAQRLIKESQQKTMIAFETNIARKKAELGLLSDSMQHTQQRYGIYDPSAQGEILSELLSTSESEIVLNRARLEVLEKNPLIPRDTIAYIKANLFAYERQRQQLMAAEPNSQAITIRQYNEGLPQVTVLQDLHFQARKQLSFDLERYQQIKSTYNTDIPALFIVEKAEVPLIKSRPKRSIIVIATLVAVFFFSILAVLIADAYRDVRWTDITQKD